SPISGAQPGSDHCTACTPPVTDDDAEIGARLGERMRIEMRSSGATLIRLLPLGFPQCPDEAFLPVKILASAEEFQTGNFARVDVPRMPHSASEPARGSPDLKSPATHTDLATLVWRLPSLCCANAHSGASSLENPASR